MGTRMSSHQSRQHHRQDDEFTFGRVPPIGHSTHGEWTNDTTQVSPTGRIVFLCFCLKCTGTNLPGSSVTPSYTLERNPRACGAKGNYCCLRQNWIEPRKMPFRYPLQNSVYTSCRAWKMFNFLFVTSGWRGWSGPRVPHSAADVLPVPF